MLLQQLVPSGEHGLCFPAGRDGGANDRDNMSVSHKQSNLVRAEVITLGAQLYEVSGALSTQFPSPVHFHRLVYPTVSLWGSRSWTSRCQCLRILNACVIFHA